MRGARTGVLGGTFDPIHLGHLGVAIAAMQHLALDRVLLIPSHTPPHRTAQPHASAYHRFAMVALAVQGQPRLLACDLEVRSGGTSFTATTLDRLLASGYHGSQLFFITGADAFAEIATWCDYPALLDRAHFVVISRPGFPAGAMCDLLPDLAERMTSVGERQSKDGVPEHSRTGVSIFLLDVKTPDVSSTEVRRRAATSAGFDGLLPAPVEQHIRQHGLYLPSGTAAAGLHEEA
jgi:nicotinate-nucleotide adenylyltransferase